MESAMALGFLLYVVIVLAIALPPLFLCPSMAAERGQSGFLWFILALFFSWIAVLVMMVIPKQQVK